MNPVLPAEMTVIAIDRPGGPEVLIPARRALPTPGAGEVLLQVVAAGINRPDCLQRQGSYPPPPGASDLPGLEVAGTVVGLGAGVDDRRLGDRVCALLTGGGYAEYCVAPAAQCLPVPPGLDLVQAAALPETFFTVWTNVFERAHLQPGETLLVHGGSSGIGTTAIQLAREFGSPVFVTVGSADKARVCEELGACRAINYRDSDFVGVIEELTQGRGVDVILDMVGGDYVQRNLSALAPEGRLVQIAFLRGARVELNLTPVMLKRLTLTGSTLRARSVAEKAAIARALRERVWPLLEAGKIKPVIYKTFALTDAAAAHRLMESNRHIGKIVLTVGVE
ncbi:MAG: NAD(P)H-quinone oxidoreductase [Candidatus Competibacteraceae bacterium]